MNPYSLSTMESLSTFPGDQTRIISYPILYNIIPKLKYQHIFHEDRLASCSRREATFFTCYHGQTVECALFCVVF